MEWLVTFHSIFRWVVLLVAVGAIVLAVMSSMGSRPWDGTSDRLSLFFTIAMDIQFLIGAILWIVQSRWDGADPLLSFCAPFADGCRCSSCSRGTRSRRSSDGRQSKRHPGLYLLRGQPGGCPAGYSVGCLAFVSTNSSWQFAHGTH